MSDFAVKLLVSAVFTLVIKGGFAMVGYWIAWWLAALIALVLVFGGWLIIVGIDGAVD